LKTEHLKHQPIKTTAYAPRHGREWYIKHKYPFRKVAKNTLNASCSLSYALFYWDQAHGNILAFSKITFKMIIENREG